MQQLLASIVEALPGESADNILVQQATAAMRVKLAKKRSEGRSGWLGADCSNEHLHDLLVEHCGKGDMVGVLNLAAMIHVRAQLYGEAVPQGPIMSTLEVVGAPEIRYEKLDENGNTLPLSTRDYAALVDHDAGLIVDVRALHTGDHASCERYASESKFLGRDWSLPSVDFLFARVIDRNFQSPAINPEIYPARIGNMRIWSSTPDAGEKDAARPVCAWYVYCYHGSAGVNGRDGDGLALPVSPLALSSGQ